MWQIHVDMFELQAKFLFGFRSPIFFFLLIGIKYDMAAKRRKKHKNKISGLVISMCYDEQKSKF
jgi:hypothetical protein